MEADDVYNVPLAAKRRQRELRMPNSARTTQPALGGCSPLRTDPTRDS